MTLLEAIVLGIVQGLTEFLPISSTAHLRIVPALLGWEDPGAAFTAVIQCGTLAAVLLYFRRDLVQIGVAWFRETFAGQFGVSPPARLGWMMIVGTIPIVVVGKLFKQQIKSDWRSLYIIAAAMILFAGWLVLAELYVRWRRGRGLELRRAEQVTWRDAIVVGLAQALALVPGASRSGVTITGGLFCGLARDAAARFSFLLSLPSVLAAGLYEMYELVRHADELQAPAFNFADLAVATVVSGVVGYASIEFLLRFLRTRTMHWFVIYRLVLGALLLWRLGQGQLDPLR